MSGTGADEGCPTALKRSSGHTHCRTPSFGHWRGRRKEITVIFYSSFGGQ